METITPHFKRRIYRKKNLEQWNVAVQKEEKEGILTLDCTRERGWIGPCYYDGKESENGKNDIAGYPDTNGEIAGKHRILAPASLRTTAECCEVAKYGCQYQRYGGVSWSIPYAGGTLALG